MTITRTDYRHLSVRVPSLDITDAEMDQAMSALRYSYTEHAPTGTRTLGWDEVLATTPFDTIEDLRADYMRRTIDDRPLAIRRIWHRGVLEAAAELAPMPGDGLIDAAFDQQWASVAHERLDKSTVQEFRESIRTAAVFSLRLSVTLDAIAEGEHLIVTQQDIEAERDRLIELVDPVKRSFIDRAEVAQQARTNLRRSAAQQWLYDHVPAVDASGNRIDRAILQPEGA